MRIFFFFLASAILLMSFSCSNAEAEKLRKELAFQKADSEQLKDYLTSAKVLLDETRGKLSKALTEAQEAAEAHDALMKELDDAKKTSLEATEKLEALATQNLKLRDDGTISTFEKRVKELKEHVTKLENQIGELLARIDDIGQKYRDARTDLAIETQENALLLTEHSRISTILEGRETRIRELVALKNQYEDVLARMKADGIKIDKYVKVKK